MLEAKLAQMKHPGKAIDTVSFTSSLGKYLIPAVLNADFQILTDRLRKPGMLP